MACHEIPAVYLGSFRDKLVAVLEIVGALNHTGVATTSEFIHRLPRDRFSYSGRVFVFNFWWKGFIFFSKTDDVANRFRQR